MVKGAFRLRILGFVVLLGSIVQLVILAVVGRRNVSDPLSVEEMDGPSFSIDLRRSSWIGNDWFPPEEYHLHDPIALQEFYGSKRVLWLGDGFLLAVYKLLCSILTEKEHPHRIDIANNQTTTLSNTTCELDGGRHDFVRVSCLRDVLVALLPKGDRRGSYDVVVVGFNPTSSCTTNSSLSGSDLAKRMEKEDVLSSAQLVWTTLPDAGEEDVSWKEELRFLKSGKFHLLDYATIMEPRMNLIPLSDDNDRIASAEASEAFIQLMTNHLKMAMH